jgi:hypothetical protein
MIAAKWTSHALRGASIGLLLCWLVSLLLPVAFVVDRPEDTLYGWSLLTTGWMAFLDHQFGWVANWLALTALLLGAIDVVRGGLGGILLWCLAGFTLVFGLDALLWRGVYVGNGTAAISAFGVGYYLWFVVVFGSAIISGALAARAKIEGDLS